MKHNELDSRDDWGGGMGSRSREMSQGRGEYGGGMRNLGSARSDYGRNAYRGRLDERGLTDRGGRGFVDRAADEVLSWFGDEDAERRREWDDRRTGDRYGERISSRGNVARSAYPGRRSASQPGAYGRDIDNDQGYLGSHSISSGRRFESDRTFESGRAYDSSAYDRGYRGSSPQRFRAEDLMTEDVATVRPDDPVTRAARIMREENVGAIPVVDSYGRARGMITDRDITCRVVAEGEDLRRCRVADAMTDDVFAVHLDAPLEELLETMREHQVRRIPVVDDRDRVVGIVSQADVARIADRDRSTRSRFAETVSEISEPTDRPYKG